MEKVWLKSYPPQTPHDLPALDKNLIQRFEEACKEFDSQPAFISFGKTLSYTKLYQQSVYLAGFLQSKGFKKGDVIVIQLPNLFQYPISFWASVMSGLTVVNMNPLYTAKEMLKPIQETKAKGIILLSNCLPALKEIFDQTDLKTVIVSEPADLLSFPKKQTINFLFRYKTKSFRQKLAKGGISFLQALSEGKNTKTQIVNRDLDETFLIQYTGGTTGISKGACLSQKNILSNLKQCEIWMLSYLKKEGERALSALPLYHIFSFLVNGLLFFFSGYSNTLVANPRQINSVIQAIKKQKITVGTGVNTLFKALLQNKKFRNLDFTNMKLFIAGGMSLEASVQKDWQSVTQSSVVEGYGLTEASPVVCVGPLDKPIPGFAGYPLSSTEIRIMDEKGQELGLNQVGELELRGPQVMLEYYKQEEETNMVLNQEGWLKTGDIALVNSEGLVKIVDRKKDIINVSGFKVYPNEVEELLSAYHKVRDSAVVAGKNSQNLEYVKAFIVKKEEDLTAEELRTYCKTKLAPYKIPKEFVFTTEIPKNILGKVLRRSLR